MKQHGAGLLDDVSDSLLNLSILVMRSDSAECHRLSFLLGVFSEEGVSKAAIVSVVVFHSDVV